MKLRQRLLGVALAAAALTGVGVSTAQAGPSPYSWQTYYRDEFSSLGKCKARGNWMVGAPPWGSPGIQGMDRFKCLKYSGDDDWSMRVRWYGRWAT